MSEINRDWELLKFPLKYDEKYGEIVNANGEIVAAVDNQCSLTQDEVNFVGNYIAESVNSRPSLEKRIAELESALKKILENESELDLVSFMSSFDAFKNAKKLFSEEEK